MAQTMRSSRGGKAGGKHSADTSHTKQTIDPIDVLSADEPPAPIQTPRLSRDHKQYWSQRFHRPSAEQLLSELNSTARKQFELARASLSKLASEHIEWLGTWHWTFVYRTPTCNGVAHAYLIPDPVKPRLCVPTDDEALLDSPHRIYRILKESLLRAPVVEAVRWAVWDIQSKEQVEAVLAFAREFAYSNSR